MDLEKLDAVLALASEPLDLTNEQQSKQLMDAADTLRGSFPEPNSLDRLETNLLSRRDEIPLFVHVAVKLARAKQAIASIQDRHHVSVIFAVYKERSRIMTREEHPLGENFLLGKIAQLNWLFEAQPGFSWDLALVDDGDPEHTGRLAEQILAEKYSGDNVRVLYLDEAIEQQLPVTQPMTSATQSQKGGSIAYGMWQAVQRDLPNHLVVFTDADLSTHLGQTGLLVDEIVNRGFDAAIGSRREASSIVVKKGVRNTRGKLFIYLWKQLVPNLDYVVDTQCGFKAFTAETVRGIIGDLIEKKFAFDIELILKTELRRQHSIAIVPIAWIDSEAASTTTDLEPYLAMLKAVAAMYRKYLPPNPESDAFAQFIESLDEGQWLRLVDKVPTEIANLEPAELGNDKWVSVDKLQATADRL